MNNDPFSQYAISEPQVDFSKNQQTTQDPFGIYAISDTNVDMPEPEGKSSLTRDLMQATIGGMRGLTFTSPAGVPAVLADVTFPAAIDNVINELEESNREQKELGLDVPEFDKEEVQKYSQKAQETVFGKEGFTTGLLTLPYRAFGIETEPKNAEENIIRNAFGLLTGIRQGMQITRGAPPPGIIETSAKEHLKDYGKLIPLSFTSASLGELAESLFGVPGRVASDILFFGGMGAYQKVKDYIKSIPKTPTHMAETAIKTPERFNEIQPYLKIASENNIPVSIGTLSDSPFVQSVENSIAKNKLTARAAQKFRNESAERWGSLYGEFLIDSKGATEFESAGAVAQKLKEAIINPAEQAIVDKAKNYYVESENYFAKAPPLSQKSVKKIEDSLNKVIGQVSLSLVPTSAETATKGVAQGFKERIQAKISTPTQKGRPELEGITFPMGKAEELLVEQSQQELGAAPGRKRLMQAQGRLAEAKKTTTEEKRKAEISVKKLFGKEAENIIVDENGKIKFKENALIYPNNIVATIRSLNDKLEWDNPHVINLLKPTRSVIKQVFNEEYKNTFPYAIQQYNRANEEFGRGAKLFYGDRAKFKKWKINSETTPDQLANELNSIEKFKQFENQFGQNKKGKELIEFIKRKKLDSELRNVFDKASINYIPGMIRGKIEPLKQNQFVKYLAGDNWNKFEQVSNLDKFISENATKIYTSGIPQDVLADFTSDLKIAHAVFNPASSASAYLLSSFRKNYLKEMSTLYSSPTLTKEAVEIARHAKVWKTDVPYWTARMQNFNQTLKATTEQNDLMDKIINSQN